jgi:hypothetical protein
MPKGKRRKRYEAHMDRGMSYADTRQGYYDTGGKPMGSYGAPPAGYIDQSGMPNASRRRALAHMSSYYSGGGGSMGAENRSGNRGTSSTNAGTSPDMGGMDPTYKKGKKKK